MRIDAPTIIDFTNAQHTHSGATSGGILASGTSGSSGSSGTNGTSGSSGSSGTNGTSGSSGTNTTIIQTTGVTLASTGWTLVSNYEYNYSNTSISASTIVDFIPDNGSYTAIVLAQVLPYTLSAAGHCKILCFK